jgi:hypothetical protein
VLREQGVCGSFIELFMDCETLHWQGVLHRDKHVREIKVTFDDTTFCLQQCATESSTWRVTAFKDNDDYTEGADGKTVSILVTYVDDFLFQEKRR